jgi:hypothetical protein
MLTQYRRKKIRNIFKDNYKNFTINIEQHENNNFTFTMNKFKTEIYKNKDIFLINHKDGFIESWRNTKKESKYLFSIQQIALLNKELKNILKEY